ncbi:MAG TPA: hypothetical protein VN428_06155 [Bryobacteraceae bacterium]|nr:hypothetical protein [Bryobacteraceae bacterium]
MRSRLLKLVLAGAAGAAAGLTAGLARRRPTPQERERKRRLDVNARGRTGNAILLDYRDAVFSYTYDVHSIEHIATQDICALLPLLPADPSTLVGRPAIIKYLASNPANSIVVCEDWSGLLFQPQPASPELNSRA